MKTAPYWTFTIYWVRGLVFGLEYIDMYDGTEEDCPPLPYDNLHIHLHLGPLRLTASKWICEVVEEEDEF